jgi:hypothetical protein
MSKRFYCVLLAFVMLLAISCVAASEDSAIDDAKLAASDKSADLIAEDPTAPVDLNTPVDPATPKSEDSKKTNPIEVNSTVDEYGAIVVNVTGNTNATGNITLEIINNNTKKCVINQTGDLANGTYLFDELTPFEKGYYIINVKYNGDATFAPSEGFITSYANVTKNIPEMDIEVKYNGKNATIIAKLKNNLTGNVSFVFNNKTKEIALVNGTADITDAFEYGDNSVSVQYLGNDNYYKTTDIIVPVIIKKPSSIKPIENLKIATDSGAKAISVTLIDNENKTISNATVTITINGRKYTGVTDNNGVAKIKVSSKLYPEIYTAVVSFNGTESYEPTNTTFNITVKKSATKITAKNKAFKAKKKVKKYAIALKNAYKNPVKGVKVYLKVNGKTYKASTSKKGKAIFKITKLTKKGTYKAKITFKGDGAYKGSKAKAKIIAK